MNKSEKEIDILIRARYPILYIVSWEEVRVEEMLSALAQKQGKKIIFWTSTAGFYGKTITDTEKKAAPAEVLDILIKTDEPAIFVLKDFHSFFNDAKIIRQLRDIGNRFKGSYKTLILLSPVMTIPVELEKAFTVIDYNLPDYQDLSTLLYNIIRFVSQNSKIEMKLAPEHKEQLIKAAMGLTLEEAENAFAKAIVSDGVLGPDDIQSVQNEKKQIIRKSGILEFYEQKEDVDNIGGLENLKQWLFCRGKAFTESAREFGLPHPKGLLLIGVQGCGKSMSAKAIANLWKLPLLKLDMGSVFGSFIGSSEENIRKVIKISESIAPVVLWLDELEKGLAGVQSSGTSDAGTTSRVFSTLLTWLQEKTAPVFLVATANNIRILPPELLRKGRFDEIFFIDLPSQAERKDIFSIHLKKRKREISNFDTAALANASEGFSGSEIEQVIISALYDAFAGSREVETKDILKSLGETVPLSVIMKEEISELREWAKKRTRKASS